MSDGNGGFLGVYNTTSKTVAQGIFSINDMHARMRGGVYPSFELATLFHFDGSGTITTINDELGNAWTGTNGPTYDTTNKQFGSASILFASASSQYISRAYGSASLFDLVGNDYCVEFWVKTTQVTANATFISNINSGFVVGEWSILINNTANEISVFAASFSAGSPLLVTSGSSINNGSWHHVAWNRIGSAHKIYVDGVQKASATSSFTNASVSKTINIGRDQSFGRYYNGNIDEMRVTIGSGVYTGAFTPPAAPFSL
jgi:hypothetical protein